MTKIIVGARLPAIASDQTIIFRLNIRNRGQARSYGDQISKGDLPSGQINQRHREEAIEGFQQAHVIDRFTKQIQYLQA